MATMSQLQTETRQLRNRHRFYDHGGQIASVLYCPVCEMIETHMESLQEPLTEDPVPEEKAPATPRRRAHAV